MAEADMETEEEKLRATIAEYEGAINWGTSCLNCSSVLDRSYAEYVRADGAELKLADLEALTRTQHTPTTKTVEGDHGGTDTVTYCRGCGTDLDEQDCPYLAALGARA